MQPEYETGAEGAHANRKMSDIVKDQDPLTLLPDTTVKEACRQMRNRRVRAVLVTRRTAVLPGFLSSAMPFIASSPREGTREIRDLLM
jgi:CBS domain-containing protein